MAQKKITYQQSIEELEMIISQMNTGDIPIDELDSKVKRAKELLEWCKEKLRSTQESIESKI
jgi:exodeoxyribonuclease VII small subunit